MRQTSVHLDAGSTSRKGTSAYNERKYKDPPEKF